MSEYQKRMMVSDITKTIYYGKVKELSNGLYQSIGKREDVTDEAIKAVFEWFMKNFEDNEPNKAYEVTFTNCPYILRMVKREDKEND